MDSLEAANAARDRWLRELRIRLLQIARRRVGEDHAEDIVQTTLRVVVERGLGPGSPHTDGLPPLAWCFQVLRNTIGNHYKRRDTHRRHSVDVEELDALPTATTTDLDSEDRLRVLQSTLEEIGSRDSQCGELLRRAIDGFSPREIAAERGLPANALYQRLYRCRRQLRAMLRERGVLQ